CPACYDCCMFRTFTLFFGCVWILGSAAAQEVEGSGKGGTALFSPADYIELSTPLTNRVAVNTYGFYLGTVRASIALVEVPVSLQKHFVITPIYLFINVPPSGLSQLTGEPGTAASYQENQFRLAGTFVATVHGFIISDRNMYVRRFSAAGDAN